MAEPEPKPSEPLTFRGYWSRYRAVLTPILVSLAGAVIGSVLTYLGVPPKTVEKVVEVIQFVPAPMLDEFGGYAQTTGWHKDDAQIAANLDERKTLQFASTPAGKAVMGDDDVYLWQAVRKVNNRGPPWYPNVNQMSVGCCVGCGWKHGADVVQASAILQGQAFAWKPVSVEVIYGLSRVEVGGGRISGDGSVGAWAAQAVREYGIVPMAKHGDVDLSTFSPARAREFGRKGVSDALEKLAKEHPVKTTALVKTWDDTKRAIQQGYPVVVCSDQGFTMERDRDGFAKPQGTWYHCMCFIGVRGGNRPGAFCLNSWGDSAHTGPVFPADAPVAGFWVDADVVERMVRQGDTFALSEVSGFPARKLDWLIRAQPRLDRRPIHDFARSFRSQREVSLSW